MSGPLRHPIRTASRLLWLALELAAAAAGSFGTHARWERRRRARWLQTLSRRLLRVLGVRLEVSGPVPTQGVLVSNHLSYLDILVYAALAPAVFVAKAEVSRWPIVGRLARTAGTVFLRRERRQDVARVNGLIRSALEVKALVIVFPEGTSSGGEGVLPFRSSLLEPATLSGTPVTAAAIRYRLDAGDPSEEVCYWRDMTLLPHLVNLAGKPAVRASVRFGEPASRQLSRKALASQLHAEVLHLHQVPLTP